MSFDFLAKYVQFSCDICSKKLDAYGSTKLSDSWYEDEIEILCKEHYDEALKVQQERKKEKECKNYLDELTRKHNASKTTVTINTTDIEDVIQFD